MMQTAKSHHLYYNEEIEEQVVRGGVMGLEGGRDFIT